MPIDIPKALGPIIALHEIAGLLLGVALACWLNGLLRVWFACLAAIPSAFVGLFFLSMFFGSFLSWIGIGHALVAVPVALLQRPLGAGALPASP